VRRAPAGSNRISIERAVGIGATGGHCAGGDRQHGGRRSNVRLPALQASSPAGLGQIVLPAFPRWSGFWRRSAVIRRVRGAAHRRLPISGLRRPDRRKAALIATLLNPPDCRPLPWASYRATTPSGGGAGDHDLIPVHPGDRVWWQWGGSVAVSPMEWARPTSIAASSPCGRNRRTGGACSGEYGVLIGHAIAGDKFWNGVAYPVHVSISCRIGSTSAWAFSRPRPPQDRRRKAGSSGTPAIEVLKASPSR